MMHTTPGGRKSLDAALSVWESEGGVGAFDFHTSCPDAVLLRDPPINDAELTQLRVRMIALENLLIGLFQERAIHALPIAKRRAASISPRPGYTQHPLTLHAAAQMFHLAATADAPVKAAAMPGNSPQRWARRGSSQA